MLEYVICFQTWASFSVIFLLWICLRQQQRGANDHSIKTNNICQIFFKILKTENIISAKNFREMVKTNNDYHKILDNFCEMKNNLEESPCHHNVYAYVFRSHFGSSYRSGSVSIIKRLIDWYKYIRDRFWRNSNIHLFGNSLYFWAPDPLNNTSY